MLRLIYEIRLDLGYELCGASIFVANDVKGFVGELNSRLLPLLSTHAVTPVEIYPCY